MSERRTIVFVSSEGGAELRAAGACALSAAAMGDRVDVFLYGRALVTAVETADDSDGEAALLHQARSAGNCKLFGCSASLVAEKVDPSAADRALDAIVGWPTILEWSRGVVDRYFF